MPSSNNINYETSTAMIALEIIGIGRHKVVLYTFSTQTTFAIEIATELFFLYGDVWVHCNICASKIYFGGWFCAYRQLPTTSSLDFG